MQAVVFVDVDVLRREEKVGRAVAVVLARPRENCQGHLQINSQVGIHGAELFSDQLL